MVRAEGRAGARLVRSVCQAVLRWLQGAVASAECEEIAFAADVGWRRGSDGEVAGLYAPRCRQGGWLCICSAMRLRNPQTDPVGGWWAKEVPVGCSLRGRSRCCAYLALGWDVAHIASEMGLSPHTVRNHSTNLRRKLDVNSSLEAMMAAVRLGVLKFDEGGRETDGS